MDIDNAIADCKGRLKAQEAKANHWQKQLKAVVKKIRRARRMAAKELELQQADEKAVAEKLAGEAKALADAKEEREREEKAKAQREEDGEEKDKDQEMKDADGKEEKKEGKEAKDKKGKGKGKKGKEEKEKDGKEVKEKDEDKEMAGVDQEGEFCCQRLLVDR